MLKPHALVLLLPGLVVGRQWRLLSGYLASLSILLFGSWLLVGVQGLRAQLNLVFEFAQPLPPNPSSLEPARHAQPARASSLPTSRFDAPCRSRAAPQSPDDIRYASTHSSRPWRP